MTTQNELKNLAEKLCEGLNTGEWCADWGTHHENKVAFLLKFLNEAYQSGSVDGMKNLTDELFVKMRQTK